MKPQRRLALTKEIGNTLAKAQLSTLDGPGAAAALGSTACRRFKEMGHPGSIFQGAARWRDLVLSLSRATDGSRRIVKYHAERAARAAADFSDAMPHDGLGPAAGTSDRP